MKKFLLLFVLLSTICFSQVVKLNFPNNETIINIYPFNGTNLLITTIKGLYLSTNNGDSWEKTDTASNYADKSLIILNEKTLIKIETIPDTQRILKSYDWGKSWHTYYFTTYKPDPYVHNNGNKLTKYKDSSFFCEYNVYTSYSQKLQYYYILKYFNQDSLIDIFSQNDQFRHALSLQIIDDTTFCAFEYVYRNTNPYSSRYLFLSKDQGKSYDTIKCPQYKQVFAKLIYNYINNKAYLITSNSFGNPLIFTTADNFKTWDSLSTNKYLFDEFNNITDYIYNSNGTEILLGTQLSDNMSYLFKYSEKSKKWDKISSTSHNETTNPIYLTAGYPSKYFFYAQQDSGLYRIDNYVSVQEKEGTNLSTIYPNPTHSFISISFNNSDLSDISISIYNSLGIEIKRIMGNELLGKSSINITTDEFSSGIYYCTLSSGINKITKSFIVFK